MHARLQQRIQRYGWDLAVHDYEPSWQAQLAGARGLLRECAALEPGQCVLDVACGSGLTSFDALADVTASGSLVGVDISGAMVEAAAARARSLQVSNTLFMRMDAEKLALDDGQFDAALCALGLMYLPDPDSALREMRRVLRPGGAMTISVWGERANCGWSSVFPIVDAEVRSEVCPMFFQLGAPDVLAQLCERMDLRLLCHERLASTLVYENADQACNAAFIGGPVALAWSRFDAETRARVRSRYVESIEQWRVAEGFRIPGEFVVVKALVPGDGP
jgi:SAM-dependent methyltransferase